MVSGKGSLNLSNFLANIDDVGVGDVITDHLLFSGLNLAVSADGRRVIVAGHTDTFVTWVVTGFDEDGFPVFEFVGEAATNTPHMSHSYPVLCELLAT